MSAIFIKLLNMSIAAGWLALAIVLLRFAFKKAPGWVRCAVWALVALRLALPFSFQSALSIIPSVNTVSVIEVPAAEEASAQDAAPGSAEVSDIEPVSEYTQPSSVPAATSTEEISKEEIPSEDPAPISEPVSQDASPRTEPVSHEESAPAEESAPQVEYVSQSEPVSREESTPAAPVSGVSAPPQDGDPHAGTGRTGPGEEAGQTAKTPGGTPGVSRKIVINTGFAAVDKSIALSDVASVAAVIWAVGVLAMLVYAVVSYVRLKLKVRESIKRGEVYICDNISSPFVFGFFRPRIYVPSEMDEKNLRHVLAHEKAHIKRLDHIWRPLGYALLSVYWFAPLIWIAYILFCRDIEIACDEKVVRTLSAEERSGYTQALLDLSRPHRAISACPVAFGETGVKERVKKVFKYKRPALWMVVTALLLCAALCACMMTDPVDESSAPSASETDSDNPETSKEDPEVSFVTDPAEYDITDYRSTFFTDPAYPDTQLCRSVGQASLYPLYTVERELFTVDWEGGTGLVFKGRWITDESGKGQDLYCLAYRGSVKSLGWSKYDEPELAGKLIIMHEGVVYFPYGNGWKVWEYSEFYTNENSNYIIFRNTNLFAEERKPMFSVMDRDGDLYGLPVEDDIRWNVTMLAFDTSTGDPDDVTVTYLDADGEKTVSASLRTAKKLDYGTNVGDYYCAGPLRPGETEIEIPEQLYGAFRDIGFTAVKGTLKLYTCDVFPGKTVYVRTNGQYIDECFVIDEEYTDPGLDYSYRVYGGIRYRQNGDKSYKAKQCFAVIDELGDTCDYISEKPEVFGKLVIVDRKNVQGLGEGEGKYVVSPCSKLIDVGYYGKLVLTRESSRFAICFGEPMTPMPDWAQWRIYDSEGNIRTLPVDDDMRWDVSRVEFDKESEDPDAVIVTFENGNTFKTDLRNTRVLGSDSEITYYYLYEYSRRDSVPTILYEGQIDPNTDLDGIKNIRLFPEDAVYPAFTIKREYKQINVGYTVTKGVMHMYLADMIVSEDGGKKVIPDCIVVTYQYDHNDMEIVPLAGYVARKNDLYNIDVFGNVYTYSRSYIENRISYSECHVFFAPEAERALRDIVCSYSDKSSDSKYLVLRFAEDGMRVPYMIVDAKGDIRSLPVPDERLGDVISVLAADPNADGGNNDYEDGEMIIGLRTKDGGTEYVRARLSDTRVLTGNEADEYYYVNGAQHDIFMYSYNGTGGCNISLKHVDKELIPEELALPSERYGLPVNSAVISSPYIKKIVIPDTVTQLSLSGCSELTAVKLPDSLYELLDGAFNGCSKITELNIPAKLRYIGEDAFRGMDSLEKITVDPNNEYYVCKDNCLMTKDGVVLLRAGKGSAYAKQTWEERYAGKELIKGWKNYASACFAIDKELFTVKGPDGTTATVYSGVFASEDNNGTVHENKDYAAVCGDVKLLLHHEPQKIGGNLFCCTKKEDGFIANSGFMYFIMDSRLVSFNYYGGFGQREGVDEVFFVIDYADTSDLGGWMVIGKDGVPRSLPELDGKRYLIKDIAFDPAYAESGKVMVTAYRWNTDILGYEEFSYGADLASCRAVGLEYYGFRATENNGTLIFDNVYPEIDASSVPQKAGYFELDAFPGYTLLRTKDNKVIKFIKQFDDEVKWERDGKVYTARGYDAVIYGISGGKLVHIELGSAVICGDSVETGGYGRTVKYHNLFISSEFYENVGKLCYSYDPSGSGRILSVEYGDFQYGRESEFILVAPYYDTHDSYDKVTGDDYIIVDWQGCTYSLEGDGKPFIAGVIEYREKSLIAYTHTRYSDILESVAFEDLHRDDATNYDLISVDASGKKPEFPGKTILYGGADGEYPFYVVDKELFTLDWDGKTATGFEGRFVEYAGGKVKTSYCFGVACGGKVCRFNHKDANLYAKGKIAIYEDKERSTGYVLTGCGEYFEKYRFETISVRDGADCVILNDITKSERLYPASMIIGLDGKVRSLPVSNDIRWKIMYIEFDAASDDPNAVTVHWYRYFTLHASANDFPSYRIGEPFAANLKDTVPVEYGEYYTKDPADHWDY